MSRLLFVTLIAVLAIGVYYVGISPLYSGGGVLFTPEKTISQLKSEDIAYENAMTQVNSQIERSQALVTAYKSVSPSDIARLEMMVPREVDPVRLVSEVAGILQKNKYNATDISYAKQEASKDGLGSYTVSFSVEGSYGQFKTLLEDIETSMRFFTIKSISLAGSNSASSNKNQDPTFQVRIQTYFKP